MTQWSHHEILEKWTGNRADLGGEGREGRGVEGRKGKGRGIGGRQKGTEGNREGPQTELRLRRATYATLLHCTPKLHPHRDTSFRPRGTQVSRAHHRLLPNTSDCAFSKLRVAERSNSTN